MKINYFNQPDEMNLGELLSQRLQENFDKAYFFSGFAKDSGIFYLLPALEQSRIKEICFGLGVDNKNTSKDMLMKLLNMGIKVMVFLNGDMAKVETRAYAFESADGDCYVYLPASKLSEGGLIENESLITEIIYGKDEKKLFDDFICKLIKDSKFRDIDENGVTKMAENGEIVARISERRIPRISEMYAKEAVEIGTKEYDEGSSSTIRADDFEDVDISVELPMDGEVQVRNSLGEEVEQVLKKTANKAKQLLGEENETSTSSKILPKDKDADYNHMSTFIFMIQGADSTGIKIPNSIAKNLSKFIDYPEEYHVLEINGQLSECANVEFEIFDNETSGEMIDDKAMLIRKEKYVALSSSVLKEMNLHKDDIVRMMKKEKGKYRLEVIRNDTDEHNIWENYCVLTVKGSLRKFGII